MSKFLGIKDKGELDFTYDFYVKQVLTPEPIPEARQLQSNIDALAPSNPKVKGLDPKKHPGSELCQGSRKAGRCECRARVLRTLTRERPGLRAHSAGDYRPSSVELRRALRCARPHGARSVNPQAG